MKKISTYISKKVSDRLQAIFKNDRKEFEEKWDDLKIFINYGMLTQEEFYEKANKFALLKDTDDKYYTYEEYQSLIKDNQTDKDGNLIYLYATHADEQYSYIDAAKNKGYNVLLMDGQLDVAMVSMLEQKVLEKSRFTRVDSDSDRQPYHQRRQEKRDNWKEKSKKLSQLLSRASYPKWIK